MTRDTKVETCLLVIVSRIYSSAACMGGLVIDVMIHYIRAFLYLRESSMDSYEAAEREQAGW